VAIQWNTEIARANRLMNDYTVDAVGTKAIVYRNVSDTAIEGLQEVTNDVDKLWNEAGISDNAVNRYSEPFESTVIMKFPDEVRLTGRGILAYDGEDPIQAQFKFEDFITPDSYIKIPFSTILVDNIDDPSPEYPTVVRFEVNSIDVGRVTVEDRFICNMGIARASDRLMEDDTEPMSHIPSDFFKGKLD